MGKIRVYELAKEAGIESKEMTAKLKELGFDVKAYNSTLDEATVSEARQKLGLLETTTERKRIQAKGKTTIIRRRKTVVPEKSVQEIEAQKPPEEEREAVPQKEAEGKPVEKMEPEEIAGKPMEEESPLATEGVSIAAEPGEAVAKKEAPEEKGEPVTEKPAEKEAAAEPVDEEEMPAPAGESAGEPTEEIAAPEKAQALEPEESAAEKPKKEAKPRKGLARVIKKAAITIPEEKIGPPAKPRKKEKPKKETAKKEVSIEKVKELSKGDGFDEKASQQPKSKKGKRFVKFHPEVRDRGKKGVKRKGPVDVEIEEVAEFGGRIAPGLKVGRGKRGGGKRAKQQAAGGEAQETRAIKKRIKVYETITVGDLAHRMGVKSNVIIASLMNLGIMATVNQALDVDTASLVASEYGYEVGQGVTEEQTVLDIEDREAGGEMQPRPPVVTVMGHVDHGKTSILDAIRQTDVAAGEAGGITQHIGAHYVRSTHGDLVFLDTPGHAAFTEMRSRGAKITDVVVLVVAADDGVMDQTREAINHAKAAEVPIVVAVNKIDKPDADVMRVKGELAEYELTPEEWGGQTIYCETSAKQKIGIDELVEQIVLQAEILELKADPKRKARGRVVEAQLHKGLGPVATVLVQQGTLRTGDTCVVGDYYGKVRAMHNDKGEIVEAAGPATPVEVHGLSGVPMAGDEFIVVPDDKMAKSVSSQRQLKKREADLASTTKISLDNLFDHLKEGEVKELRVILRADTQGTLEAFSSAIEKLSTDEIKVKVLHQGTGAIIESDVLLAAASDALIFGFNVRSAPKVTDLAQTENVDIRYYDVIYHALDDIRKAMTGMLEPTYEENVIGNVEVRETFQHPKVGTIAGCYVTGGKVERNAHVRIVRDGVVIYTGKINSLRRFKDDVKEVQTGYECGIGVENYNDIKVGDTLEVFKMKEVAGVL